MANILQDFSDPEQGMIPNREDGAMSCNWLCGQLWEKPRLCTSALSKAVSLSEVSGRGQQSGQVTVWPYPMGDFRSFASSSLRGGAAGLQGCDSQRKGKEREPRMETFFLCPAHAQGPVGEDGLGAGGKDAAGRAQGSSRKRPTKRKDKKQWSLLIVVSAF